MRRLSFASMAALTSVRSNSSFCGEFGILLQMLFEDARELEGTVAGLAESSAEFLLLGFRKLILAIAERR